MRTSTYLAAAAACVALAGCTVHQTEAPPLTGPSDSALNMSMTVSPQSITQNGADASVVTAKVYFTDPRTLQTTPKANVPIRFDMAVGGVGQDYGTLSARSAVTDANGIARATYTAPPSPIGGNVGTCNGVPGTCVTILASISDSASANPASGGTYAASVTILLMPAGVILPPAGTPKAAFSFLPASNILVGMPVAFDASASCATDQNGSCTTSGSIASYSWSFGDGQTGTGKTATHTYTTAGTFVVTLTVTSDRGVSASTSQSITVGLPAGPTADFVFSPGTPIAGQTIFFNADTSKSAPGHNIVEFSWVYGDGATDSGIAVSHAYAQPGQYTVVLSVADDTGQKATKTTTISIGGANPTAKLNVTKTGGNNISADASLSTAVSGSSIASYTFNFGDGTAPVSGTAAIVTHPYALAGGYTVTVVVTDSAGRTGSTTASVTVP